MVTDKIRKYVLPNIPYLFIGWFCLKIGTAYRLAVGAGFGVKLLGLGQTIGAAFASFAPGLAPLDWFVGIVGAVGFRLLIYCKAKKAKKFRRDAEYGTARWGNEKDIKPFIDPKFENNMLLTATERLTMNTRPKNPANARNLNFCGIGSSGSGKTRFWLTPQLLQAHSSYVVVDPKGGVLGQVGAFLQRRGYQIKVFNSIDFSKSMHYNPLSYIRNEADILKFVNALITNTKGEGKEGDPFWTKAETLLYCALIAYIIFEGPAEDRNMNTLVDMISGMEVKEDDENYKNAVDYMYDGLAKRKPDCFAVKQYRKFKLSSFDFRQSRSFRVGQTWGAASYLQIMASELSDKLLLSADFFRVIIDIYRKKEEPPMRIIFKILAAPFVLVLTLLVAVLSFLLSLSAGLLSILASVLGLLSVLMLFVEKDISTGIAGLLMAFAISPFGLPALAGWLLAKLDELNGSLRGFIMG